MAKQLCIIHANCQGDSIKQLLLSTPAFSNFFYIEKYTNYLHDNIPTTSLKNCKLFIYQQLSARWGENATDNLLQKLSPSAQTLCIPNMFFNGYWPLWTNATHMAYGDMLIEYLAQNGLSIAEILHIYFHGDIRAKYDLEHLFKISRTKEIEKEKNSNIKTLDLIDSLWREELLFYTVNHPAPRLVLHVVDGILDLLGMGKISPTIRDAFTALEEEFIQPIHPQVTELFNLSFVTKNQLYNVYGQKMNFEQYTTAYVNCRMQQGVDKIDDFVVYLHLLAQKEHGTWAA